MVEAVLFDVDGTLVDTSYLHTVAWSRAFAQAGTPVDMARIHRQIGKGSELLVRDLVGRDLPEAVDAHEVLYAQLHPEVRAFDGASDLLRAVAGRGVRVVLASSARPADDEANRRALGAAEVIHTALAAGDVDEPKPAPDLFAVALERAGVAPDRAIAVGDSTWDVESAGRAGLACVGVTCGGISAAELRQAGAVATWLGPADLLAHLDDLLGLDGGGRGQRA